MSYGNSTFKYSIYTYPLINQNASAVASDLNVQTTTLNPIDVDNYVAYEAFKKNLDWIELLNEEQIKDFVFHNIRLLELIQNAKPIIKEHFPENSCGLEFEEDPEISSLNKLVLYVKGDESSFDEDWEEVKKVNREIRKLSLYDDSVKNLLSVDLW